MPSCEHPIDVFVRSRGRAYLVPCGKCACCRQRKKQSWIHRVEQEALHGEFTHCFFITLTYNDKFLSYESFSDISKGEKIGLVSTGEPLLNPYDLRMFFKRFRLYSGEKIAYFAVGEYGDVLNTRRPHFHIILFTNLNWQDTVYWTRVCWSRLRPETSQERYARYKKSRITGVKIKRDGFNLQYRDSFGGNKVVSVTPKRISYVCKYVNKSLDFSEVVPCFFRASNGLGLCFLKSLECSCCKSQNLHYSFTSNGCPVALSRYYSHRMFTLAQMDAFYLDCIIKDEPPEELLLDSSREDELIDWYEYKARYRQSQIRQTYLNLNYVRRYS